MFVYLLSLFPILSNNVCYQIVIIAKFNWNRKPSCRQYFGKGSASNQAAIRVGYWGPNRRSADHATLCGASHQIYCHTFGVRIYYLLRVSRRVHAVVNLNIIVFIFTLMVSIFLNYIFEKSYGLLTDSRYRISFELNLNLIYYLKNGDEFSWVYLHIEWWIIVHAMNCNRF